MKTNQIESDFAAEIESATIRELTRQRDSLLAQVNELSALVREIPTLLTLARLDAREGKETRYDYNRAAKALAVR